MVAGHWQRLQSFLFLEVRMTTSQWVSTGEQKTRIPEAATYTWPCDPEAATHTWPCDPEAATHTWACDLFIIFY